MAESITRVTLLVPGAPNKAWNNALRGFDVEVEAIENDGAFGQAFSFGTVTHDVVAKIDAAPGALVLHWPLDLREGRASIVSAVTKLRDAGALAVRIEQSKMGWDTSRWIELFSAEDAWSWHRGAVTFISDADGLQSCGMHAFSLPDVRLAIDDTQDLGFLLNVYQLAEDPVIRSGQTFTPERDAPRRVLERWPDTQYPPNHPCHNAYGVWRVGPAGGKARPMGEHVPTFMPTLRAHLHALESRQGALTRSQVEAARDQGVCIAMQPRDAQRLERERGYADLDPELAWEQWQLVRS